MTDILTAELLCRLTGKKQYAAQRRWLHNHGWIYETDSIGRPVVDVGYYSMRMGTANSGPTMVELDFSPLYG